MLVQQALQPALLQVLDGQSSDIIAFAYNHQPFLKRVAISKPLDKSVPTRMHCDLSAAI
jgi:hypothetical protein